MMDIKDAVNVLIGMHTQFKVMEEMSLADLRTMIPDTDSAKKTYTERREALDSVLMFLSQYIEFPKYTLPEKVQKLVEANYAESNNTRVKANKKLDEIEKVIERWRPHALGEFKSIRESIHYSPPESNFHLLRMCEFLAEICGQPPVEDWAKLVYEIWMKRPV